MDGSNSRWFFDSFFKVQIDTQIWKLAKNRWLTYFLNFEKSFSILIWFGKTKKHIPLLPVLCQKKIMCRSVGKTFYFYFLIFILFYFIRHFRSELVNWNKSVYCTPIDRTLKMWFNEGSGSFLRPTIPELWRFLWNQLQQNKYTNIRRFSTISCHKIRIFSLQKVQQNTVLSKMATQHIFN